MNLSEEQEIKKEFQLERVILFSDAVFAIIITIMVIDIKLPEGAAEADLQTLQRDFFHILIKLTAYAASFFLVANFWIRHLKIFSFLKDYNIPLLLLNLFFLFTVSLFPFAISLITGTTHLNAFLSTWAFNIYFGIILGVIFSQTLLTRYLVKHKAELCIYNREMETVLQWKAQRINLLVVPLAVVIIIVFNYFNLKPTYTLFVVALLMVANGRLRRYYYPDSGLFSTPFSMLTDKIKKPRK